VHPDYAGSLGQAAVVGPAAQPRDPGVVQMPHIAGGTSYQLPVQPLFAGAGVGNAPGPQAPTVTPPPQLAQQPYLADPGYQASLAQQQMGLAQLDAAKRAAVERAIIQFGDPSLAQTAGFGLDPQAAAFARQNYLSGDATLARIDKNREAQRRAVINRLAGHGILNSGDLGYGIGEADTQYGNQVYDARQAVLDYLNGVTSNDLQQRQSLGGNVVSALQGAYQNYLNHPELLDGVTTPAAPPTVPMAAAKSATAAKKAVVKQLSNPYTTGQKKRG
jgi:hypothetical protein